jgi:ATP-binding cassette subfamily F protein uup
LWLEKLLNSAPFASVTVSHDRYFLENVATDMAEINRTYPEGLFRVRGNYSEFLDRREQFLEAQSKHQEALANKVAREVEWLRRGPKARTTKSKARIDAAGVLMEELAAVNARTAQSTAVIDFTATDRKTKRLLVANKIEKSLGGKRIFSGLNVTLTPGLRLGLVGANGSGKTTLLRIFAGELGPDGGTIDRADNLRTVYFEQHREQLDPAISLRRALCPNGDSVIYRDRPIHVASWARRFLFNNEQLDVAVGRLSGGEKARVVIARLILQPADVLLLDEPTNDLDISTLEVLEDSLLEFSGALVLVTHDRYMLDRVSTLVLGLNGDGSAGVCADYSQWEQFRQSASVGKTPRVEKPTASQPQPARRKLSYMESREWETIEAQIAAADSEVASLHSQLQDPNVTRDAKLLQESYEKLQLAQKRAEELYARWAELEVKQQVEETK